MEGGERKEEGSLPPGYVSLAQLQERWLRKQEERKLKQKQEEEDRKESDARVQNEKNQDQRRRAKMTSGFVRVACVIQDKGEEKETVDGGPGNGGKNNKGKKNGRKKAKFNGTTTVVEVKEKAEVLNGRDGCGGVEDASGDTGKEAIFSRKGGNGGEISGFEEIGIVFAVEVLARNGEIADVKRSDLRKKSKRKGSRKVNELKQREVALDLEKEREDENDRGIKWKKGERGQHRGGIGGRAHELKQTDVALDLEKEKKDKNDSGTKWREKGRGRDRGEQGRRNGDKVNELKQSEVALDLKKEKEEVENDYSVKWRGRGRGKGERRGINEDKVNELMQSEVALYSEKVENDCGMKWRERRRGQDRRENRRINGTKVHELKQSEVALDFEKEKEKEMEVENDCGMKWGERGRGQDRGEHKGRNGAEVKELKLRVVALDLEKEKEEEEEHDCGMKSRERDGGRDRGEQRGRNGCRVNDLMHREVAIDLEEEDEEVENDRGMKWRERGRNDGYPERRINRLKEYRPVVLTGNKVGSDLENMAEDGISEICSEISSLNVGEKNELRRRDNKVQEGGAEREYLNGDKLAVKIEEEVLARQSDNFRRGYRANGNMRGGLVKGYRKNEYSNGGFGRRRYARPRVSDAMNSIESVKVWVKKEDKLGA